MTLTAEAPARPIFGEIRRQDMEGNELLAKTVLPLVRDACKHSKGRFTVDSVARGLISGEYRLWGVMVPPASLESVAVTTIETLASGAKAFHILIMGPDFAPTLQFLPVLEREARKTGCVVMRTIGPRRWVSPAREGQTDWVTLPKEWQTVACIFEKKIGAG